MTTYIASEWTAHYTPIVEVEPAGGTQHGGVAHVDELIGGLELGGAMLDPRQCARKRA